MTKKTQPNTEAFDRNLEPDGPNRTVPGATCCSENASEPVMSVMDAISQRRSVRNYTQKVIDKSIVSSLLNAAVLAPTAMHQEPWAFVVIQDRAVLDRLSDSAKSLICKELKGLDSLTSKQTLHHVADPKFHVFYNAGTLILICMQHAGPFVEADCWLAAENLLLAARAKGLGTCVIGFAVEALNTKDWKAQLNISKEMTVVAPIIVGEPAGETAVIPRKSPQVLFWK